MERTFFRWGCILAFLAVAIGAFGAHILEGRVSESLMSAYHTGVQYHMFHAIGLIGVSLAADKLGSPKLVRRGGWLLVIGVVLFSGSLYALALSGITVLGAITPLGGLCFLAGWLVLALAAGGRK